MKDNNIITFERRILYYFSFFMPNRCLSIDEIKRKFPHKEEDNVLKALDRLLDRKELYLLNKQGEDKYYVRQKEKKM